MLSCWKQCFIKSVLPMRRGDISAMLLPLVRRFVSNAVSSTRSQKYSGPAYPLVTKGLSVICCCNFSAKITLLLQLSKNNYQKMIIWRQRHLVSTAIPLLHPSRIDPAVTNIKPTSWHASQSTALEVIDSLTFSHSSFCRLNA